MRYYSVTDKGKVRKTNQDSLGVFTNRNNEMLFIVCDGVGGNNAGDIASSLTVSKFGKKFEKNKGFKSLTDARKFISRTVTTVNNEVYLESLKDQKYSGMATTLTGLMFTLKGILLLNIGDSRVYSVKNKKIEQLSTDHSYVNELIKAKLITEKEALNHPKKNMITRAVGATDFVEADIRLVDETADYYLISSDGLHDYVDEDKIESIITSDLSTDVKVYDLLNAALDAGGPDNISIILIEGEKLHD